MNIRKLKKIQGKKMIHRLTHESHVFRRFNRIHEREERFYTKLCRSMGFEPSDQRPYR